MDSPEISSSFQFAFCVYTSTNFHYEPHTHPHHELVLMQQGRLRARIAGSEYVVNTGDVIVYPANVEHEEWVENNKPALTWDCGFPQDDMELNGVMFCRDSRNRVQELVAELAHEYHNHGMKTVNGRAILRQILAELNRLRADDPQATIEQVRAYMQKMLANEFTLDDLAGVVGLSKTHLTRLYRTHTGRTPMEDVRHLRVEEARRLILTTTLSLQEIAPQVGIKNEFHLSRLLKSVLGVGARDLRPPKR